MTMHGLNKQYNTRPGWVIQKILPQSKARQGRHGGQVAHQQEENKKIATLYWSEAEGKAPRRWLKGRAGLSRGSSVLKQMEDQGTSIEGNKTRDCYSLAQVSLKFIPQHTLCFLFPYKSSLYSFSLAQYLKLSTSPRWLLIPPCEALCF